MERDATVFVLFCSAHVRAAETARHADLASLGPALHRRGNRHLHGPAEGTAPLELPTDALCDNLRIGLDLLYFLDLDVDLLGSVLLEFQPDALDVRAFLADQHPWLRRMDDDCHLLGMPDDLDLGDVGVLGFGKLVHPLAERQVLVQGLRVIARIDVPARLPILVDTEPEPDWIYFLAHLTPPTLLFRRRPR